jgi:hypothetical protein
MPTSSGLTPLTGCRFITQKFSYKQETLASSQYKCKKTKNCKKNNNKGALKVQRNCSITAEKMMAIKSWQIYR